MESFFKKHFWSLQALFLILAAILLAGAVNAFIGTWLVQYAVGTPTAPAMAPNASRQQRDSLPLLDDRILGVPEPEAVVDRCAGVTCAENESCDPESGSCVPIEQEEDEGVAPGRCIESDIAIDLVGTMVSEDPEWSVAILRNPSLNQTQFARVGTTLLAEAQVTHIERNRIFFNRNGRQECLMPGSQQERAARAPAQRAPAMRDPTRAPDRASPSTMPEASPPSASRSAATMEERIRTEVQQVGPNTFSVPRDLIETVANDNQMLERQAPRIQPHYDNGQPRGFRLSNVASGSIFSAIGIRNGDVITGVNGTAIDSPQRALELYQAMLQRNEVSIEVLRRGNPTTLTYQIR